MTRAKDHAHKSEKARSYKDPANFPVKVGSKWANYVSRWNDDETLIQRREIRRELGWFAGKQDEDGDFIPDPCLTPVKAMWLRAGQPVMRSGVPVPPWIDLPQSEIEKKRATQDTIIAAETARQALGSMTLSVLEDEVADHLQEIIPELARIAANPSSTSNEKVRAAKEVREILLAIEGLTSRAREKNESQRPMIAVQVQNIADGKVTKVRTVEAKKLDIDMSEDEGA